MTTLRGDAVTEPDEILDTGQLAAYLKLPESTVERLRWAGDGPKHFKVGRHVRYTLNAARAWVQELERKAS